MHEIRNVLNFPAADMACSTLDKLKKLKTRFGGHHRAFTATVPRDVMHPALLVKFQ
jgi:hypothetical protein